MQERCLTGQGYLRANVQDCYSTVKISFCWTLGRGTFITGTLTRSSEPESYSPDDERYYLLPDVLVKLLYR